MAQLFPSSPPGHELPAGAPDRQPRVIPDPAGKSRARYVLVVDDEPLIRWSLAETLSDRGCRVIEADCGEAALRVALADGALLDCVLLDLRMPDSSDLTLLAALRKLAPAARIILLTAFGSPELAREALALGAYRVVSKPFEIAEVAALVLASGGAGGAL